MSVHRCLVTHNLVGTDTRPTEAPCPCAVCELAAERDHFRDAWARAQVQADTSTLLGLLLEAREALIESTSNPEQAMLLLGRLDAFLGTR